MSFGRPTNNMAQAGSQDDIAGTQIQVAAAASAASAGAGKTAAVGNMAGNSGGDKGKVNMKKRGSLDDIMGIKVSKPAVKGLSRGATTTILQEGDAVEAMAPHSSSGSDGGTVTFSPGVISRVHDDGSVDVGLDTGDKLVKRPPTEVRLVKKKDNSSRRPPVAIEDLAEGDRVEARCDTSALECSRCFFVFDGHFIVPFSFWRLIFLRSEEGDADDKRTHVFG